jgi:hypothetical protein
VKAWYCPSWNGDWRLDADGELRTRLSIVKPTPAELKQLASLAKPLDGKGWISQDDVTRLRTGKLVTWGKGHVTIKAPLSEVGPLVTSIVQPGPAVLTAVRFRDGQIEVTETSQPKAPEPGYRDSAAPPPALPPAPESEPTKAAIELAKKPEAEKAATVKRPTPCCPPCYVDAVGPATDVLLSFLDEEQHECWRDHRYLVARGGLSGHRYLIAHRNTPMAARNIHIAYDLDDMAMMHFHDWTVPPEEEVLAAMLILRYREPWLRNEATALGVRADGRPRLKYKNPFGDGNDGVVDSVWTHRVGDEVAGFLEGYAQATGGRS